MDGEKYNIAAGFFLRKQCRGAIGADVIQRFTFVFRHFKFQLPSTAIKAFEADSETVSDPDRALQTLLRKNQRSQRALLKSEVAAFADRFRAEHGLDLVFQDDAVDLLVELSITRDKTMGAIFREKFKDLAYGLKLISKNTGRTRFEITRAVADAPEQELSRWIVESFAPDRPAPAPGPDRTDTAPQA